MLILLPDDADDGLQPIDVTEIDNTMTVETVVPTVVMTRKEEQIDAKRKFAKKFLNDCKTALAEYERENGEIILPLHYSESIQTAASLKLIPVSDPVVTNEQESIDSFQNWATANHMFDVRLTSCNKPVQLWVQLPGQDKLTQIVTHPIEPADHSKKVENSTFPEEKPTVVNVTSSNFSPKKNVEQKSNTLYLMGVPRNSENHQQTLENHFQWCEGFKCAGFQKNASDQAKGFAFIHFLTVAQAENAIKQRCNATLSINGKVLRATFSSIASQKNK